MKKQDPSIVVIGGGTGSFTLLSELKNHTRNITAVVNMVDDGGSTGVLRDEFGVLPPGDVRQCLVALSKASEELRDLFTYRYPADTSLAGHSFGNLFLSTMELMSDDFAHAVKLASKVLSIRGKVLPITLSNCSLSMEVQGRQVQGQYAVENSQFNGVKDQPQFWLEPRAAANPEALKAIHKADLVVIAPGNLYASLIPALIVDGVKEALASTNAPIVYVCNLINKPRQVNGYGVHDYAAELERFIGQQLDAVLYNTDKPTKELLQKYALEGEFPVEVDEAALKGEHYESLGVRLLASEGGKRNDNDTRISRSLIRHDAVAVTEALLHYQDSLT